MDPTGIARETGQTARSFFDALKEQPLSLALVVMNFILLFYLFYSGASITSQRNETTKMIVGWQERTDQLMASCVSREVLESVVGALERQLQEMRRQLRNNGHVAPEPLPVPLPRPRPSVPGDDDAR
jgi:hypothetical protein